MLGHIAMHLFHETSLAITVGILLWVELKREVSVLSRAWKHGMLTLSMRLGLPWDELVESW
jgi:hypothetical protein